MLITQLIKFYYLFCIYDKKLSDDWGDCGDELLVNYFFHE